MTEDQKVELFRLRTQLRMTQTIVQNRKKDLKTAEDLAYKQECRIMELEEILES